ncbi:glycosyltransferase family 2 protein [Streptomyces sp. NPDC003016]
MSVPLIAVIGAVEDDLLAAFVEHYRNAGITEFFTAFHFPDHVPEEERQRVLGTWRRLAGPPAIVSTGPWHEHLHGELRDRLRHIAGEGWHAIADSDEFHAYPRPIDDLITEAESESHPYVRGVLLDRVAADGGLEGTHGTADLDLRYPLGGFITAGLTKGNPRKIILVRSDVELALGSHYSPAVRIPFTQGRIIPVHHFKWRPPVLDDLRRRVDKHTSGDWSDVTSSLADEASRFLDHVLTRDGRMDTDAPGIDLRPVTLRAQPEWWETEARTILCEWQVSRRPDAVPLPGPSPADTRKGTE